jgi:hypothetical protein
MSFALRHRQNVLAALADSLEVAAIFGEIDATLVELQE